jgi:8-oxo-dGTP diphosphatase
VAASCHSAQELERAALLACDFAVFGPVRATASHPGAAGIGWDGFASAVGVPPLPVFGLGGLSRGDLDRARQAGAHGIAAIRAAWEN